MDPSGSGLEVAQWFTGLATLLIALGAGAAWFQLRDSRQTRLTESSFKMMERWESAAVQEAIVEHESYDDQVFLKLFLGDYQRHPVGTDFCKTFIPELDFFEDLGALVNHGGLSYEWVDEIFGGILLRRWEVWAPCIDSMRRVGADPRLYDQFEWLTAEIVRNDRTKNQRMWGFSGW
jgi:hypothetical protein